MNTKSTENSCLVHNNDSRVALCYVIQSSVRNLMSFLCYMDPYVKIDFLQAGSSKSLRISDWLGDYGYYSNLNLK